MELWIWITIYLVGLVLTASYGMWKNSQLGVLSPGYLLMTGLIAGVIWPIIPLLRVRKRVQERLYGDEESVDEADSVEEVSGDQKF